jgi:tetratricopeptide (TPR) repeat protein
VSFFIILRILAWRQQKKFAALGKLNDEAIALLQAGELAAASKLLDGVVRSCDASPALKCVWEYNRGLAHMRQGHMSTAISAFNAALGSKSALKGIEAIITRMRCDLAICHACNGDLDAAEQAQARAHDRAAADTHGALLLMDVLIGLRRGRPAFVLKDAEAGWLRAEGSLSPHQVKALRLLSAFGHSQLPDAPAHAEHIEQMLAGVRPFRPGEFDYLVGNWPEFRAFLERNGFVAA